MSKLLFLYTPLMQMGGAERNFLEEVNQFRIHGVACEAITFKSSPDLSKAFGAAAATVNVIPRSSVLSAIAPLRNHIRKTHTRLLIAHTSPELAYLGTIGTGVPYVLYLNSPPFYKGYPENQVIYSWRYSKVVKETVRHGGPRYREFVPDVDLGPVQRTQVEAKAAVITSAVRHARAVIVWSHLAAEEVTKIYRVKPLVLRGCIPDAMQSYVPRSSIRDRLGIRGKGRVILTVSRLDPVKRIDLLIRAFDALKRTHDDAVLVIVGTGPDEGRLKTLVAELGTKDITFTSLVPDQDLWDYYATSDVFVTPAWADFNIAPFEALALGCRVVWSSEMETEQALEQSGAVTTADPSVPAFAEAIAKTLGARAPVRWDMTPYLWSIRYASLSSLYDSILRSAADVG